VRCALRKRRTTEFPLVCEECSQSDFGKAVKLKMTITSLRKELKDRPTLKLILQALMIGFFAIAGVIVRLSLTNAAIKYHLFSNYTHFLPNSVGSLVMGFISPFPAFQKAMPLTHKSIATGFCGSLTTFSSWMFAIMSIADTTAHGAIEQIVAGLAIPAAFFLIGRDLSTSIEEYLISHANIASSVAVADSDADTSCDFEITKSPLSGSFSTPEMDAEDPDSDNNPADTTDNSMKSCHEPTAHPLYLHSLDICIMLGSTLFVVVPIILLFSDPQSLTYTRHNLIACLWAPTGAISRMIICDLLNPIFTKFKIGTFICNVLATFIDGVLIVTMSGKLAQDVIVGQMGSLSTVSSWVNDAYTIRTSTNFSVSDRIRYSFLYYFGTVFICVCIAAPFTQSPIARI
jgi:fluoride exporter